MTEQNKKNSRLQDVYKRQGLTTSGYYGVNSTNVNGKPNSETGLLKVINAGEIITQTMHTVSDNLYIRNKHNGVWTAWRQTTLWT